MDASAWCELARALLHPLARRARVQTAERTGLGQRCVDVCCSIAHGMPLQRTAVWTAPCEKGHRRTLLVRLRVSVKVRVRV